MRTSGSGAGGMAKKQKTIQLPEDIYTIGEAFETGTGVRFNRQLLAALLQFYFGDSPHRNSVWMRLATMLERGQIALPSVVGTIMQEKADRYEAKATQLTDEHPDLNNYIGLLQSAASEMEDAAQRWQETLAQSDNPLDEIKGWFLEPSRDVTPIELRIGP